MSSTSVLERWKALGLRARLVALFLAFFGAVLALFASGVYFYVARLHQEEFDAALYNYAVDLSHTVPAHLRPGAPPWEPSQLESELLLPFSRNRVFAQVLDERQRVVLKTRNLGARTLPPIGTGAENGVPFRASPRRYGDARFAQILLGDAPDERIRMVARDFDVGERRWVVQLGVPTLLADSRESRFLVFLLVLVPLSLLLAGWAGYAASRGALAPIAAIVEKADAIGAQDLSQRIPVPGTRDEIRALARTLNGLLERLELAFRSQEAFVADASHQLRTPLSILKGELELFRRESEYRPEQVSALLESVAQEVESLERLVTNLLLLAQADSRQIERRTRRFDFGERVLECVARAGRAPNGRGRIVVNLHPREDSTPSFDVEGDPELARALVENLVDNALKYSPPDSIVRVDVEAREHDVELRVKDSGPGIAAEAMPQLFDRFFRLAPARDAVDGAGLGLAIVRRVAKLHRGTVSVDNDAGGGATFTVRLPRVS
jgi:signal transduction histidine kinase